MTLLVHRFKRKKSKVFQGYQSISDLTFSVFDPSQFLKNRIFVKTQIRLNHNLTCFRNHSFDRKFFYQEDSQFYPI